MAYVNATKLLVHNYSKVQWVPDFTDIKSKQSEQGSPEGDSSLKLEIMSKLELDALQLKVLSLCHYAWKRKQLQ